jgi:hypothetical protein
MSYRAAGSGRPSPAMSGSKNFGRIIAVPRPVCGEVPLALALVLGQHQGGAGQQPVLRRSAGDQATGQAGSEAAMSAFTA